jgi:hypothetical protein
MTRGKTFAPPPPRCVGLVDSRVGGSPYWGSRRNRGAGRDAAESDRSVRNESFRIADKLQAGILSLNATLLRFVLGRDPADWQKFSATGIALQTWVTKQQPSSSRELQELAQVRSQLAAYEAQAKTIVASDSMDRNKPLAVLSGIENASKNILNLGYNLATAHRAAIAQLVDESQKSLTVMQLVITGALALLLAIGL